MGRLHADIFFQDRYMLNEVNVKIKLVRSKDIFCVMSQADEGCDVCQKSQAVTIGILGTC